MSAGRRSLLRERKTDVIVIIVGRESRPITVSAKNSRMHTDPLARERKLPRPMTTDDTFYFFASLNDTFSFLADRSIWHSGPSGSIIRPSRCVPTLHSRSRSRRYALIRIGAKRRG